MIRITGFLLVVLSAAQSDPSARALQAARELQQRGAAAEASKAYEAALPGVRASGDRKLLAGTLLEAGRSALAAGNYPRAIDRAEEAAGLFRTLKDAASEALAENLGGNAQLYRGEYAAALAHYRRALELDRQQHDFQGEINRLNNIANVYFFQGKYLDALDHYQEGLRRAEENTREPWAASRRQLELTNLAILYEQLGQNPKALDYYKQALAGESALIPLEHGQLLSNAGTLYRRLGDAVKALEMYREAQRLFAREHLSDAEIHVLQNVGIALALDMHDARGAGQAFSEALEKAAATNNRREIVLAHLFRGEAYFRTEQWTPALRDFAEARDGARAIGASEEEWTALYGVARIERREGRGEAALATLREAIAKIESVRLGLGAGSLKSDFLANKRDVYDAAIDLMLEARPPDTDALFRMFEQARSRNLQDVLRTSGPPSLKAVQARLPAGSVLLEYWMGGGRLAVLWASRDSAAVASGPGDEAAVRGLAAALRGGGDHWRHIAAQLSGALLRGVPGARHLLIVPDGALYLIPFEVLPMPSGRLVIDEMPVSYLPSAALLLRDPARGTRLPPWRRQLIGFGDPIVDASGTLPGDARWGRLREAGHELAGIARALPGRAQIHAAEDDQKRFLFGGATAGTPLIHMATHAVADTNDANRSRILFTPEPGQKGSEYLFRGEVQGLKLEGTDLVTLSACDTEAGRMVRGEGVQSFSRAFLAAGARSTVTTLWRVEDHATADFMQVFYQHLAMGEAKAEALRAAKLSFLRQGGPRAQPLYWAAFVLSGDGQEPIRPVLSWWWLVLAALVTAGAATAYRRRPYFRRHPTL